MLKPPKEQIWFFDCEWVPDPKAGRLLYQLPATMPDREVLTEMWRRNGATPEHPRPYLKPVLCRIVSIAAVLRRRRSAETKLDLLWLPRDMTRPDHCAEASVIGTFLQAAGRLRPQLVGFNSRKADLRILAQRALVQGVRAADFFQGAAATGAADDIFAPDSEYHVDLKECLSGDGFQHVPSLNEIAVLSGIPGKFACSGDDVAQFWLDSRWAEIVQYNCFDAITTYLVWLRLARLAGHLTDEHYDDEQQLLMDRLLELAEKPETEFLNRYLEEWERLQQAVAQ